MQFGFVRGFPQMFELFHLFAEITACFHVEIFSCILFTRHEHILSLTTTVTNTINLLILVINQLNAQIRVL